MSFDFRAAVAGGAATLGVEVDAAALDRMATHQATLARWAPRVNLVANADPAVTAERHFVDSLALLRLLDPLDSSIADIGAGAGFPGLVLAAARPDRAVTLVEPLQRRSSFLATAAAAMGLGHVRVLTARLEALGDGTESVLVSRAVLPPLEWLTAAARVAAPGGRVLWMGAAPPSAEEHAAATGAGLVEEVRDAFTLPTSGAPRVNVLYRRAPLRATVA